MLLMLWHDIHVACSMGVLKVVYSAVPFPLFIDWPVENLVLGDCVAIVSCRSCLLRS
jgi:hypothetical protein